MRKGIIIFGLLTSLLMAHAQPRADLFKNPPMEYRVNTYWQWMNGNISCEGIVKDLEYMARAGYGRAMIFNVGVGIPCGKVDYNSKEWVDDVKLALTTASRLGMRLAMHNSPGYSGTGGRWITPETSMKELVWTDTVVRGAGAVSLATPIHKLGFYRDIAVFAFPVSRKSASFRKALASVSLNDMAIGKSLITDNNLQTEVRLEKGQTLLLTLSHPVEINQMTLWRGTREKPLDPHDGPRDYAPALRIETSANGKDFTEVGTLHCPTLRARDIPGMLTFGSTSARYIRITSNRGTNIAEMDFHFAGPVLPSTVVDISRFMDADGSLRWKKPKGNWEIVRIGYTTTGETVGASCDSGKGLECDKLSTEGVDRHFDEYLAPLLTELRQWCGNTLESLAIDSWEAGSQDWTRDMPSEFQNRRGYSIMPWLLALTGRTVGDSDQTQRFRWDFRRTCADLFNEYYVGRFRQRLHEYGLTYCGEAYGDGPFESLEMAARQDMPMSEYWTHNVYGNITTTYLASSAAHVWGQPVVGCECFTGTPFNSKFTEHPYGMKATMDYLFASGINQLVYHATTHQPYTGPSHGVVMTMGPFGTHLDRTSTWADLFQPLNQYAARCSYMLRQGHQSADVLYLKDEAISSGVTNYNMSEPATPYGYRWDITSAEGLLSRIKASNGRMVTPDGMSYRLLVVPNPRLASPEVLQKIMALADAGVPVLMPLKGNGAEPKIEYPGLDPMKQKEVEALSDSLLSNSNIWKDMSVQEALKKMGLSPDFSLLANAGAQIHWLHRTADASDIYFIANHRRRKESFTVMLRATGKVPCLWDAESGSVAPVEEYNDDGSTTTLSLTLQPSGSVFVVLKGPSPEAPPWAPSSTLPDGGERNIPRSLPLPHRGGSGWGSVAGTFTLSLWAKPETFALNGRGMVIYPEKRADSIATVGIGVGQNGVKVYERSERGMSVVLESKKPLSGWTHIAVVYDGGAPVLYQNGERVATGTKSSKACMPALDSESSDARYVACFEGDETGRQLFDRALTDREVAEIYRKGLPVPEADGEVFKDLSADWTVSFPLWSKAPQSIGMQRLHSLTEESDFDVRHFSGTATYQKTFNLSAEDMRRMDNRCVVLDLERVENIATVSVNGSDSIIVWKAPYECDITGLLHKGINNLTVKVTNLYPNRMIGDESLPAEADYDQYGQLRAFPKWYLNNGPKPGGRVLFVSWKEYNESDPLLEAGLTSGVRILLR